MSDDYNTTKHKATEIGKTESRKRRIESTKLEGYGTKSQKNSENQVQKEPKRKKLQKHKGGSNQS